MKTKKKLAIYTHNLKFFYQITQLLKKENIPFKALDSYEDYYQDTSLILTTPNDFKKYKPIIPGRIRVLKISPEKYNLEETLIIICQYLQNVKKINNVIIAIDPGSEKMGVAVFLNKVVVYSKEITRLPMLGDFLKNIYHLYPNADKSLKIGEGDFFLTMDYLDFLKKKHLVHNNIEIQLIDEFRTSNRKSFTNNRFSDFLMKTDSIHEKSAILIGQRKGKRFFISSGKEDIDENGQIND